MAESEASEPDFGLAGWAEGGACEAGEFFFGGAGRWATDLLAVDDERQALVVLLELEGIAVRKSGFSERDARFHGDGRSR